MNKLFTQNEDIFDRIEKQLFDDTPLNTNLHNKRITIIKNKISVLEELLLSPPHLIMHGLEELNSIFSNDWKRVVYNILLVNDISPVWILNLSSLEPEKRFPNKVKIEFFSIYVKRKVFHKLDRYIENNSFKLLTIEGY